MQNHKKLKIADFRQAVRYLDMSRNSLYGATQDEIVRMDVAGILGEHLKEVRALIPQVPPRFSDDLSDAQRAITSAEGFIARWQEKVAARKKAADQEQNTSRPKPVLRLVHSAPIASVRSCK